MAWSAPETIALWRMLPLMVLGFVAELEVFVLLSLRRPEWRSDNLVSECVEYRLVVRCCGQVCSPPISRSALVNVMCGALWPSTIFQTAVSTSSLRVTPVSNLTLPMYVLYPVLSLVRIISSSSSRRSLRGWWIKPSGSMVYLRLVLMMKALFVRIENFGLHLLVFSASEGDGR